MSYEETENCGVGGEGDSSCAHGIPDGNLNHELHGTWTVLKGEVEPETRYLFLKEDESHHPLFL
jgi:hypothetical protein